MYNPIMLNNQRVITHSILQVKKPCANGSAESHHHKGQGHVETHQGGPEETSLADAWETYKGNIWR
jgi:hypothetical protein